MVCSHCNQPGHTITTCPILIENRAQCIFTNGYDPKYSDDNLLMKKYWFTLPGYLYRLPIGYDRVNYPNNEYVTLETRMTGSRKVIYIENLDEEDGQPVQCTHACHLIVQEGSPMGYRTTSDRLMSISPSSIHWRKIPDSWFSANHPSNLGRVVSFYDNLTTLKTINARLKVLNDRFRDSLPISIDEANNFISENEREEFAQVEDDAPLTIEDLSSYLESPPVTPPSRVTHLNNANNVSNNNNYEDIARRNQERNIAISENIIESGVLTADTQEPEEEVQVSDATTCGICWDDLKNSNVMVTKCGHKFCCDCILSHFQAAQGNNCPLCRTEYCKRVPGWLPPQDPERPRRNARGAGRPRRQQPRRRGPDSTPTNEQVDPAPENVTVRDNQGLGPSPLLQPMQQQIGYEGYVTPSPLPFHNINHDIQTASNEGRISEQEREAIQRAVTDATQGRVDVFAMGLQALLGNNR